MEVFIINNRVYCPECTCLMKLDRNQFGLYYKCEMGCRIYHKAHPDGKPLGVPADKETRQLRQQLHRLFEQWYHANRLTKKQAYKRLAKLLNMSIRYCHISMFNKQDCLKYIPILEKEINSETVDR